MWPSFYLRRHGDSRDQREVLVTPREIRSPDAHGGGVSSALAGSSVKILASSTSRPARLVARSYSSGVDPSSCMDGSFGPGHCIPSKSAFLGVLKVP